MWTTMFQVQCTKSETQHKENTWWWALHNTRLLVTMCLFICMKSFWWPRIVIFVVKQQLWVEIRSKKLKILILIVNSIHFSVIYVHWFIWFVVNKRATSPTAKYHIMSRPWFIYSFIANVFSNHIAPFHIAHECSLVVESPLHNVANRTYF